MWMALIAPGQFTANAQPTNISAINTGAANNDKSGDTLRIAFGKINTNFSYLTNLVRTITNSIGSVTNIMTANVVWDFPSTSSGSVADLGANITGVKDGDQVIVSPPQAAMTGIIGFYTGFASNGVAYGRFVPTAATQDPASATFRVVVTQYQ